MVVDCTGSITQHRVGERQKSYMDIVVGCNMPTYSFGKFNEPWRCCSGAGCMCRLHKAAISATAEHRNSYTGNSKLWWQRSVPFHNTMSHSTSHATMRACMLDMMGELADSVCTNCRAHSKVCPCWIRVCTFFFVVVVYMLLR